MVDCQLERRNETRLPSTTQISVWSLECEAAPQAWVRSGGGTGYPCRDELPFEEIFNGGGIQQPQPGGA